MKKKSSNSTLFMIIYKTTMEAMHVIMYVWLVLRISCNFMFDDWLQLSDQWLMIIGLWWALKSWHDFSTSYKFWGIIHVIYFFQIPVAMNSWRIMSWNCNLFWIKNKISVLLTEKCSDSILKNAVCTYN